MQKLFEHEEYRTPNNKLNELELWERRRLRENSHELRDLKSKLKTAYWRKELNAQMAENEERRFQEKLKILEEDESLKRVNIVEKQNEEAQKQKELDRKIEYRKELEQQIDFKRRIVAQKYEEFLREKSLIDSIVERIRQEDENILQERLKQMLANKSDIEAFRNAQNLWQQKRKEQIESEEEMIQRYVSQKELEFQENEHRKRQKDQYRTRIRDEVAKNLCDEKNKQQERQFIQCELLEHERIEAAERRECQEMEERIKKRLEMRMGLDDQLRENELKREKIAQNEENFRKMMQKNIEEINKLEIMTAERRRIKKMELNKELREMISQRKSKEEEELKILLEIHNQELEASNRRNQLIKEERLRMLAEHADHLIGYLPYEIVYLY